MIDVGDGYECERQQQRQCYHLQHVQSRIFGAEKARRHDGDSSTSDQYNPKHRVKIVLALELSNSPMNGDVTDFRHGLFEADLFHWIEGQVLGGCIPELLNNESTCMGYLPPRHRRP